MMSEQTKGQQEMMVAIEARGTSDDRAMTFEVHERIAKANAADLIAGRHDIGWIEYLTRDDLRRARILEIVREHLVGLCRQYRAYLDREPVDAGLLRDVFGEIERLVGA